MRLLHDNLFDKPKRHAEIFTFCQKGSYQDPAKDVQCINCEAIIKNRWQSKQTLMHCRTSVSHQARPYILSKYPVPGSLILLLPLFDGLTPPVLLQAHSQLKDKCQVHRGPQGNIMPLTINSLWPLGVWLGMAEWKYGLIVLRDKCCLLPNFPLCLCWNCPSSECSVSGSHPFYRL